MHKDYHSPHTHTYIRTYDNKRTHFIDIRKQKYFHANANSNTVKKKINNLISLISKATLQSKRPFHTCHLFLKIDKFKVFNNIYFSSL